MAESESKVKRIWIGRPEIKTTQTNPDTLKSVNDQREADAARQYHRTLSTFGLKHKTISFLFAFQEVPCVLWTVTCLWLGVLFANYSVLGCSQKVALLYICGNRINCVPCSVQPSKEAFHPGRQPGRRLRKHSTNRRLLALLAPHVVFYFKTGKVQVFNVTDLNAEHFSFMFTLWRKLLPLSHLGATTDSVFSEALWRWSSHHPSRGPYQASSSPLNLACAL